MKKTIECFLSLINSSLYGKENEFAIDYSEVKWDELSEMAGKSGLLPLIFSEMTKISEKYQISDSIMNNWRIAAMNCSVSEYNKYFALRSLLEEARKEGIKLVLFKGCVLADLYPQYTLRCSCDTDIFVYKEQEKEAIALLERLGYIKDEKSSKDTVHVYELFEKNHIIELHTCLWEDYKGARIDTLSNMNLTDVNSIINISACNMEFLTLGHTEHLIFQMFHIIKHFSLRGISMRYLVDIALFVNRYIDEIRIAEFWDSMKKLGYDKFCDHFFFVCNQYFHLDGRILEPRKEINCKNTEQLLLDFVNVGDVFDEKSTGWQILGIMTPYLVGEETYSKSRKVRKLKVMFPSQKALPDEYYYAKKHKVLLPVAWVHKGVKYVIKYNKYKKDWYDASEKLTIAEYRISLLNTLGLIEGK